ncbi:MAG: lysylphosphatidylglycerol synthase transmembrane domain-containing protein [Anaerolineae bacterium]|jgi:glycosyltransferase 2 family protein
MLKRWQFWLGMAISAVFLYFAVRGLDLPQVWQYMKEADYWWLLPGVAIYFFGVWARTWRWHYMLRALKPVPLQRLFPVVCIGYMGNNIYPARIGELLRAYVLRQKEGVSVSASLATILVERIFDGVVMLLFVFIGLPLAPTIPDEWRRFVVIFSLLFFGALAVFFVIAASPRRAQAVYGWVIERLVPERFREPVRGFADRFMEGLYFLRSGRDVAMIFVTSLVVWLAETGKYWFVMHAFPFEVSFFALMLMNGVVNLFTTLPSAPGYVGTFDTPGIRVLSEVFGVSKDIAAAYTVVLHAALWLPITLLGAYYMWRESLSWQDLGEASRMARKEPGEA